MVKIWEVDFSEFDPPSSQVAVDKIGSQDLSSPTSIVKVSPLPTFSFRPGVQIQDDSSTFRFYDLLSGGNTNAAWNSSYGTTQRRSFVLWMYPLAPLSTLATTVWGCSDSTGALVADNGWSNGVSSGLNDLYYRRQASSVLIQSGFFNTTAWNCLAATIDRGLNQLRVYLNGVLKYSSNDGAHMPSTTRLKSRLGDWSSTNRRNSMYMGKVTTYDHILTLEEIEEVYNTGLRDTAAGDTPLHTISGTVYGLDNQPADGATLYLLRESSNYLEYYTTTVSGYYEIPISYSGAYTLVSTNTPDSGGRAQPFIATTSGLDFV